MINLEMREPASVEATAGITEYAWTRQSVRPGAQGVGSLFGAAADDVDLVQAAFQRAQYSAWVNQQLLQLRNLGSDWDSYGARPVQALALRSALDYLVCLIGKPRPALVPTPDGGIQLEWHSGDLDVEIEIQPNGNAMLWVEDGTSAEPVGRAISAEQLETESWLAKLVSHDSARDA